MTDLVIRSARAVTPGGIVTGDVTERDGAIVSIGPAPGAPREIDAGGALFIPGGVDRQAHIEQMSGMGGLDDHGIAVAP